jgi:hypothetical protein
MGRGSWKLRYMKFEILCCYAKDSEAIESLQLIRCGVGITLTMAYTKSLRGDQKMSILLLCALWSNVFDRVMAQLLGRGYTSSGSARWRTTNAGSANPPPA